MKKLKKSVYLINIPLEDGNSLFIHGYTGAMDVVPGHLAAYLEQVQEVSMDESPFSDSTLEALAKRGYITTMTDEEEYAHVVKVAHLLHEARKRLHKSFSFLVTYNCNFRCPYCFENGISCNGNAWSGQVFTRDMVDKAYMAMQEIEPRKELHAKNILLYGGEPLLKENRDIVSYIVQKGQESRHTFSAITNGYDLDTYVDLLSPELINTLQITLDGCREFHDSRRKHYLGTGTFDKIMVNIGRALSRQVRVAVRINTDVNNFGDVERLSTLFRELGYSENPCFSFHSSILRYYQTSGTETDIKYMDWNQFIQKHYTEDKEDIACQDFNLYHMFYDCLLKGKSYAMTSASCSAQYNSYIFDPSGNIYTCLETVGKEQYIVGRFLSSPIEWSKVRRFWQDRNIATAPNCRYCKYALLCGGGCLARAKYSIRNGFGSSVCIGFSKVLEKSVQKAYKAYKQLYNV